MSSAVRIAAAVSLAAVAALVVARFGSSARNAHGPLPDAGYAGRTAGAEPALAAAVSGDARNEESPAADGHAVEGVAQAPLEPPTAAHVGPQLFVVHGRVRAGDRAPFGAWAPNVVAMGPSGERRIAEASADGSFALAGLEPGTWSLRAGAVGFRPSSATLELSAEQPIARCDLTLERSALVSIRMTTPEGEDLHAALRARRREGLPVPDPPLPVATREPPGATIEEANGAGQDRVREGTYWDYGPLLVHAPLGSAGVLELECELPAYVSLVAGASVLETRRVETAPTEVAFVVGLDALLGANGVVRARFVGANGADVQGELWIDPIGRARWLREEPWRESLPPGEYTLRFVAPGWAWHKLAFTLDAGQELELGDIVLEPELTVSGRLLDSEGRPVRADISLGQRDARGVLRFDSRINFASDAEGEYEVSGLVPGRYWLRVEPPNDWRGGELPAEVWVSGNTPVSTLGGSVLGFDLALVRASLVVLRDPAALPKGARCKVLDALGDVVRYAYPEYLPRLALPPGAYTLVLCDEEWNELSRRPIELGEGTLEVDLGS